MQRTPLKRKREKPRQAGLMARVDAIRCTAKELVGMPRTPRMHKPLKLWPEYKAWLSEQACVVSGKRPVEVAHCGPRGLSRKCDDRYCLPLATEFHREGKTSHHVLGKNFWKFHRLDRDSLIADFNARYAAIDPKFEALL